MRHNSQHPGFQARISTLQMQQLVLLVAEFNRIGNDYQNKNDK